MNREQVFLAVLTGVVACGPKFKRREPGQCGSPEVDYDKMIKITNNVTDAVMMSSVDPAEHRKDVCYSDLIQSNRDLEEKSIRHQTTAMRLQAEIDHLRGAIKVTDGEIQHLAGMVKNLQADKDALRKAVEDGAMEIERLRNTLKGVEQIARMKPEDVEMLKSVWDKVEKVGGGTVTFFKTKEGLSTLGPTIDLPAEPVIVPDRCGVYQMGSSWINQNLQSVSPVVSIVSEEIWPMTVPEVVPVDIKNDLASAVANSTEGQRVVVEDLEATVDVDSDRIDQQVEIGDQIQCLHAIQNIIGEQWYKVVDVKLRDSDNQILFKVEGDKSNWYHPYYFGLTDGLGATQMPGAEARWRKPKYDEAPVSSVVAAEDPEEYVLITDPTHKLRACDDYNSLTNMVDRPERLQTPLGNGAGWLSVADDHWFVGKTVEELSAFAIRCKRKDLPVTPPAAESQS